LAIHDQRAIDGDVKTPDQAAKLPAVRAKLLALYRYIRHAHCRAEPMLAGFPRFCDATLAGRFHHGVVDFLELHARPAHADERDERSEHFVRALTDLVDARVAHHSFQWKIDKVCRAAMNLKHVIDAFPETLGREYLQHRGLEHVIFQTTVDERSCDR